MTETDCPDYLTRPCTCEPACCPHCPHDQAVPLPPLVDPAAWRRAFVSPEDWNAAVEHSRANPTHVLGPYEDEQDRMQMECTGCDFDTAKNNPPRKDTTMSDRPVPDTRGDGAG